MGVMRGKVYIYQDGKVVPKQEKKLIQIEPMPCLYQTYMEDLRRMLLERYLLTAKPDLLGLSEE